MRGVQIGAFLQATFGALFGALCNSAPRAHGHTLAECVARSERTPRGFVQECSNQYFASTLPMGKALGSVLVGVVCGAPAFVPVPQWAP